MEDAEQLELRGRVHLWVGALSYCSILLHHAKTAAASAETAPPATAEPGSKGLHPYGSQFDLTLAYVSSCALAVIVLCQVFNTGKPAKGAVAGNKAAGVSRERDLIVARAFPSDDLRAGYDALIGKLIRARNGMLAHADGEVMDVVHDDGFVFSDNFMTVLAAIDVDEFFELVARLQRAAIGRSNELDGEQGMGGLLRKTFGASPGKLPAPELLADAAVALRDALGRHLARSTTEKR
jgi:hypothetical protein